MGLPRPELRLAYGEAFWDQCLMAMKKNEAAVALGRLGGLKGGRARAAKMSAAERSASARQAARARWAKRKK